MQEKKELPAAYVKAATIAAGGKTKITLDRYSNGDLAIRPKPTRETQPRELAFKGSETSPKGSAAIAA